MFVFSHAWTVKVKKRIFYIYTDIRNDFKHTLRALLS